MQLFLLYTNEFKIWEFGKAVAQIFWLERATIVQAQDASEDKKMCCIANAAKNQLLSSFVYTPMLLLCALQEIPD